MVIVQLISDAVNARLLNAPSNLHLEIYNLLSYFCEGAEHSKAYKAHRWDGRASFYSAKSGTFPAGFFKLVLDRLTQLGVQVQVSRVPAPEPLGPPLSACVSQTGFAPDARYAYQGEVVDELVRQKQMIAQVATGGGKSLIAAIAYWRIARPTLFLTTRSVLMDQMKAVMEGMDGGRVGVLGNSVWEPNFSGFNVGMVQTIAPRLQNFDVKGEAEKIKLVQALDKAGKGRVDKRGNPILVQSPAYKKAAQKGGATLERYEKNVEFRVLQLAEEHHARRDAMIATLQRFEFVILEEAHEVGSDGYYRIMKACTNAFYRLALTATPFMRTSDEASMRLMAASGAVGARITEKRLIDLGILATPKFKFIKDVPAPADAHTASTWGDAQKIFIVDHLARNERICAEARQAVAHGLSVLILVIRQRHGHLLKEMLTAQNVNAKFIYGATDREQRNQALKELASGAISVLIGSNILDIGVDVPSLGMVVLAGGGKAEEAARQRIGRGLRAKKSGPNVALIVDFADQHNEYTRAHSFERKRVITETEGFKENLLPSGANFDFALFAA